jgi:hypothetical protein
MAAEPRGAEPAALVQQAADAVSQVYQAGLLPAGARVAEYGSPHGGSWLGLLADRGLKPVSAGQSADVLIDCFGMMHAADQYAALAERSARLADGGILLLQYHSLATIVRTGQWNALRHGHYAYYSTPAVVAMLAAHGLVARAAWQFSLYGGTVLLAVGRRADSSASPDAAIDALLAAEDQVGVRDPAALRRLQADAERRARAVREWLVAQRSAGREVVGYAAASRAVALLCMAGIDSSLLPGIVDASPSKQGLRMPGTDIPLLAPAELATRKAAAVLLFVADLLPEARAAFPEVEAAGGEWVMADALGS